MKENQSRSSAPSADNLERAARFFSFCSHLWRWLKPACRICCWGYGILSISGMLFIKCQAERVTLLAVVNYAPPLLWVMPFGVLIPMAFLVRGLAMLPLFAAAAFWWFGFAGWESKGGVLEPGEGEKILTLITYNRGQAGGHSLEPFLAETRPDLVVLQDARGKSGYYRGHPVYGVYQEVRDEGEFVLLSKYPVAEQVRLTAAEFPAAEGADVLYGVRWEVIWLGHPIAIYSIHFPSPRRYLGQTGLHRMIPEIARWMGGAKSWANDYWQWRVQLTLELARRLKHETLPWIMLGDLNTPPRGISYACLAEVGQDLHYTCGAGFGFTFPGDTRNPLAWGQPWIRLDYVFVESTSWRGKWLQPELGGRSQHRPLAAGLVFRGQ